MFPWTSVGDAGGGGKAPTMGRAREAQRGNHRPSDHRQGDPGRPRDRGRQEGQRQSGMQVGTELRDTDMQTWEKHRGKETHPFILCKYLQVPTIHQAGVVLGAGNTAVNKTSKSCPWNIIF